MRDAIVVLTVAQLVGNGSRVYFNRADLDRAVIGRFSLGAIPLALVGGAVFVSLPAEALTGALGAFLLVAVVWRRSRVQRTTPMDVQRFTPLGASSGFSRPSSAALD